MRILDFVLAIVEWTTDKDSEEIQKMVIQEDASLKQAMWTKFKLKGLCVPVTLSATFASEKFHFLGTKGLPQGE